MSEASVIIGRVVDNEDTGTIPGKQGCKRQDGWKDGLGTKGFALPVRGPGFRSLAPTEVPGGWQSPVISAPGKGDMIPGAASCV